MKIEILTLFPEMFECLNQSLLGKAQEKGLLKINIVNIRDFSKDKHRKCDDYAFGGGAGMLMTPQPLNDAILAVDPNHEYLRIYMSPKGKTFCQKEVLRLANFDKLLFVCGAYEGIDQRIIDIHIDEEISIGDYVLTGGELPTMVVVNSVARYVKGVLGSDESTNEESFADGLLEYPQYTRPQNFNGHEVPEVLLSGNHHEIAKWREQKALEITKQLRPDLLEEK